MRLWPLSQFWSWQIAPPKGSGSFERCPGARCNPQYAGLEADGPCFPKSNHRFAAYFHLELIFVFASTALPGDAVCGMISYFKKWGSAVGMEGSGDAKIKGKSTQIIGSLLPAEIR